jgi:hypothetical protein
MDQLRNFTQTNRSSIVNIIYIVAAFVLVYYIVMYYFGSDTKDEVLIKNKIATNDSSLAGGKAYILKKTDGVRLGNEYTISFWIYISEYTRAQKIQGILSVFDAGATGDRTESLLFVGLHPSKPQMIIRAGDGTDAAPNDDMLTWRNTAPTGAPAEYKWGGSDALPSSTETHDLKPCDIMDIDVQRWLNVTISINGRIMDVYLDGKLARSCIMAKAQVTGANTDQMVLVMPTTDKYSGYISGLQVSNYAVTPDVIYGRYQAGPYYSASFLDYLVDKLGIRISYTGNNATESESWLSFIGLKA